MLGLRAIRAWARVLRMLGLDRRAIGLGLGSHSHHGVTHASDTGAYVLEDCMHVLISYIHVVFTLHTTTVECGGVGCEDYKYS